MDFSLRRERPPETPPGDAGSSGGAATGTFDFLWRGRDSEGVVRSERVAAENAQAAKEQLIQRGWTDLELISDEIAAASGAAEASKWKPHTTPDQEAANFEGRWPGPIAQWWRSVKELGGLLVAFGVVWAWGLHSGRRWEVLLGGIGFGLTLVVPAVLQAFFSTATRQYARLNRAKVGARWGEVLECVESLRRTHRLTRVGVGELELGRCRAQALAGLGRLDEGLAELRAFEGSPAVPRWLYLSHLSGIYDTAKAHEKSLECRRQAAAEKPDGATLWIDIAYGCVCGLNRPAEAREALARAEGYEITGLGKAYLPFVRGVICWREGRFAEAKGQLEEALILFEPWTRHDSIQGVVVLVKGYLCAVEGALGNVPEAKKLFAATERFLAAHREDELLDACRRGTR